MTITDKIALKPACFGYHFATNNSKTCSLKTKMYYSFPWFWGLTELGWVVLTWASSCGGSQLTAEGLESSEGMTEWEHSKWLIYSLILCLQLGWFGHLGAGWALSLSISLFTWLAWAFSQHGGLGEVRLLTGYLATVGEENFSSVLQIFFLPV